ncbi:unnamed protein product, partial [Ectocarpus sp. 12 AP-2014]
KPLHKKHHTHSDGLVALWYLLVGSLRNQTCDGAKNCHTYVLERGSFSNSRSPSRPTSNLQAPHGLQEPLHMRHNAHSYGRMALLLLLCHPVPRDTRKKNR